ncbi:MAG: hypothetical protein ACFB21_13180 [Opitutales bacterium]
MYLRLVFPFVLAGASLASANTLTLNSTAVTDAQDEFGNALAADSLVLWLVDPDPDSVGGGFEDLIANSGIVIDSSITLEVGNMFGGYQIVSTQGALGTDTVDPGEIGSGFSLNVPTTDSPTAIDAGDMLGVIWFPTEMYNEGSPLMISEADAGLNFGFASVTASQAATQAEAGVEWSLPMLAANTETAFSFVPNAAANSNEFLTATGGAATFEVQAPAIPEPAAVGLFMGLGVILLASRRR